MELHGYIAAVLSKRAAKKLRARATHVIPYCHHITMVFKPDKNAYAKYASLIGKKIAFTIEGISATQHVQIANVTKVPSENSQPHITISCALGTKPKAGKKLAAKEGRQVTPYRQRGFATVTFIPFD